MTTTPTTTTPTTTLTTTPTTTQTTTITTTSITTSMTTSPCKDVTVGGCFLDEDNVIQTVSIPISAEACQDLCYHTTNCTVFQHNAENCTLLREDYRQKCNNLGGPLVNK